MEINELSRLDLVVMLVPMLLFLLIGILNFKKANQSASDYFLSGRSMPWWLLGISMVATTFAADTPNLVTDIVRKNGVAGNWVWWIFLLTGMLTVFVYAKLWRRAGLTTDLAFYELRYGGKKAALLRGFRALYLGLAVNVVIMATVSLAIVKFMNVLLGWDAWSTLLIGGIVTLIYSVLGGLRSILITDLLQFVIAMVGTVGAAYFIVNMDSIGGLQSLVTHPEVSKSLDLIPDFQDKELFWSLILIPLAVQWWSVWYPGAEPGGGGYVVQRMLSAKDEKNALYATFLFNISHYALRPWPWIIIALASIVVFPNIQDVQEVLPHIDADIIDDDLAYPAMLTFLPSGILGLVLISILSAYMSTISTHLNWGSSYIAFDFYKRFLHTEASEQRIVWIGRISTVVLLILSSIFALYLESALDGFQFIIQIGAGTGLIYILRWFWWRVNAWGEIMAMLMAFCITLVFEVVPYFESLSGDLKLCISVLVTTLSWIAVCLFTKPESDETLIQFLETVKPFKWGWKPFLAKIGDRVNYQSPDQMGKNILAFFLGVFGVYFVLFGTGLFIYGEELIASVLTALGVGCLFIIVRLLTNKRKTHAT